MAQHVVTLAGKSLEQAGFGFVRDAVTVAGRAVYLSITAMAGILVTIVCVIEKSQYLVQVDRQQGAPLALAFRVAVACAFLCGLLWSGVPAQNDRIIRPNVSMASSDASVHGLP